MLVARPEEHSRFETAPDRPGVAHGISPQGNPGEPETGRYRPCPRFACRLASPGKLSRRRRGIRYRPRHVPLPRGMDHLPYIMDGRPRRDPRGSNADLTRIVIGSLMHRTTRLDR